MGVGIGGGQIGFDEGALFDVMSKPKRVKVKRTFDKDNNCIEEITTTMSYWDAVMIAGGPALIFAMINSIKWIGQKTSEFMSNDEIQWYKDHPGIVFFLGPIGAKAAYEFVDKADDPKKALLAVSVVGWRGYAAQAAANWGFERTIGSLPGIKDEGWEPVPGGDEQDWTADNPKDGTSADENTIQGGDWQGYQLRSWTNPEGTTFTHWYDNQGVAIGDQGQLAARLFEQLAFWKPDAVAARAAKAEAKRLQDIADAETAAHAQLKADLIKEATILEGMAGRQIQRGDVLKAEGKTVEAQSYYDAATDNLEKAKALRERASDM